jgi:DNA-directed RNA polymerase specialized sigma24 family protein
MTERFRFHRHEAMRQLGMIETIGDIVDDLKSEQAVAEDSEGWDQVADEIKKAINHLPAPTEECARATLEYVITAQQIAEDCDQSAVYSDVLGALRRIAERLEKITQ